MQGNGKIGVFSVVSFWILTLSQACQMVKCKKTDNTVLVRMDIDWNITAAGSRLNYIRKLLHNF